MPKTMFQKIWDSHVIYQEEGQPSILYVDLHLVHEVTSAQAFEGLRTSNRKVRRPDLTIATADHNVPTSPGRLPITDSIAKQQIETLNQNCDDFDVPIYGMHDKRQGIVHVIGPEQGLTQPGKIIVCGDSHTSTHGAFGAFAMGIGTSEVEHVLATQTIRQFQPKTMQIKLNGPLPFGVTAKDVILGIIGRIGVAGATGYAIEYSGEAIKSLSMDERMTICNMSIEAGARAGMIAPDQTTFEYLRGRPEAPSGNDFDLAVESWSQLTSDPEAVFDSTIEIDSNDLEPFVTWGTNPGMVTGITGQVPSDNSFSDPADRESTKRALEYMGLKPETKIQDIKLDRVFIGSCTNARLSDLRAAAEIVAGRKVKDSVYAMVVPGSSQVKTEAEAEGIDSIFKQAGFDWREAGCSMCLGMNPDTLDPGERCASTSNRNFEGRQGKGGRTHLVSPQMAAAAAIEGHFVDIREW
ncbi:MAG: 3-isopropylmalate dehydratase large subunit [SAR202 cluster bacterium]|nr:3-isopropylmalate dehydratase large subunit [SAR202 cluster bacterium]